MQHQRLVNQVKGVLAALCAVAVMCWVDQLSAGSITPGGSVGISANSPQLPPTPSGNGKLLVDNGSNYVEFGPIALNNVLIGAGAGTPTGGLITDSNVTANALTVNSLAASVTNRLNTVAATVGVISVDGGAGSARVALGQGALGAVLLSGGAGANPVFTSQGAAGTIFISQGAAANPVATALSGAITMTSGGVTTIGANQVTLADLATQTALTIVANATNGAASPTAVVIGANQGLFANAGGTALVAGVATSNNVDSSIIIAAGTNPFTGNQGFGNHDATNVERVVFNNTGAPTTIGQFQRNGNDFQYFDTAARFVLSDQFRVVVQVFTSSGTYTPTANMMYCTIECLGGGGGGGSTGTAVGQLMSAAGGGAGSYSRLTASSTTIGASKAVTIGAAGTAGSSGGNAGGNGGDTSVGVLCVGKGGAGGGPGASPPNDGGAGGVAGTGDITATGSPGGSGSTASIATIAIPAGMGGSSMFGGGGIGGTAATGVSNGSAATGFGAGGGAGQTQNSAASSSGGAGTAGLVVVTEYVRK